MILTRTLPLLEADAGTTAGAAPAETAAQAAAQAQTGTADTTDYKALYEQEKADHAKLKASFDKTSSDLAGMKKAEKARMTDDEKAKAEAAEKDAKFAEMQAKLSSIETQKVFADAGYAKDDYEAVSAALVKACGEGATEVAAAVVKFVDGAKDKAVKLAKNGTLKEGTVTPDGGTAKKEGEDVSYARKLAKDGTSAERIADIKKLYS